MSLNGLNNVQYPLTLDGTQSLDVTSLTIDGQLVDLTNLVPYTGADKPVDVGNQPIRTTYAPVASNDVVNLDALTNAVTYVDNSVALTYLNKITTSGQTIAGPVTFTNGLQTSTNKDVSLASTVIITPNYPNPTVYDGGVTAGSLFGTITNSGGIYQSTSGGDGGVLVLGSGLSSGRVRLMINLLVNDTNGVAVSLFGSSDGVNPYQSIASHTFPPNTTTFWSSDTTFTLSYPYIILICNTASPGLGATVKWYGLTLYQMGVAQTNVTMPSQTADRVVVLDTNKRLVASGVTTTSLSYIDNLSSDAQSQINSKASTTYVDTGLAGKLNLSGSNANQNIVLGSFKVQSNATPTASTDYITKAYGDSTYALTSALANYLPLTGGTLSGALTISSGALTANTRLLGVPDAVSGGNFWIGLTGSDNEDKRLAISIVGDQVSGTCSGVTISKPLTVQATETISLFGTNAKTTPSINFTTTGNHYNDTAGTTYLMNAPSGEMMLSYSTTRSATVANLLFGAANTDVSEIVSISGDGTAYLPMNMGASQFTMIGNNATYASRSSNPSTAQVVIKGKTTSERLLLGAYYTSGSGSCCGIQASDYYSGADHGQTLLINTLGGNVGIGSGINGTYYDANCKFTINSSYSGGDTGGFCINASDSATYPDSYNFRIYPYFQSAGNIGYQFMTYNGSTGYNSFKILSNGDVSIDSTLSSPARIAITNGDPGDLISKRYGGSGDRYGIGQYSQGTVRVFGSNAYGNTSIRFSLATDDVTTGAGAFKDLMTMRYNGVLDIKGGNGGDWAYQYLTRPGGLIIGRTDTNYGGEYQINNNNVAGFMMECLDSTEIQIHDSGARLASFMYYSGNNFTIGRDSGYGVTSTSIAGFLNVTNTQQISTGANQNFLSLYANSNNSTEYINLRFSHAGNNSYIQSYRASGFWRVYLGFYTVNASGGSLQIAQMTDQGFQCFGSFYTAGNAWCGDATTLGNGCSLFSQGWDRWLCYANGYSTAGGYAYYNQGNALGTISDRRIKRDFLRITEEQSVAFLKALEPTSFCLKEQQPFKRKRINEKGEEIEEEVTPAVCSCRQDGWVAQNVLEACEKSGASKSVVNNWYDYQQELLKPEEERKTLIGVSDRPILSHTVNVVKALMARVEVLEAREVMWEDHARQQEAKQKEQEERLKKAEERMERMGSLLLQLMPKA